MILKSEWLGLRSDVGVRLVLVQVLVQMLVLVRVLVLVPELEVQVYI